MFKDRPTMAMIPAQDLERASAWYRDKLGLEPAERNEEGLIYRLNGTTVLLYESRYAGTNKATMMAFETPDLDADMATLRGKGVQFLDYDLPGFKTENGVASMGEIRGAWCNDSEGNILAISQRS
jgi:catechol 2,3-dioxygenase-like lactoylglutathione lyase family enzyme